MGLLERTCEHTPSSFRLREFVALLQEEVNDEQHDAGADPLFFVPRSVKRIFKCCYSKIIRLLEGKLV